MKSKAARPFNLLRMEHSLIASGFYHTCLLIRPSSVWRCNSHAFTRHSTWSDGIRSFFTPFSFSSSGKAKATRGLFRSTLARRIEDFYSATINTGAHRRRSTNTLCIGLPLFDCFWIWNKSRMLSMYALVTIERKEDNKCSDPGRKYRSSWQHAIMLGTLDYYIRLCSSNTLPFPHLFYFTFKEFLMRWKTCVDSYLPLPQLLSKSDCWQPFPQFHPHVPLLGSCPQASRSHAWRAVKSGAKSSHLHASLESCGLGLGSCPSRSIKESDKKEKRQKFGF